MLHELLSILRTSDPLRAIGENFAKMVTTTHEMTITAGDMLFEGRASPETRSELRRQDRKVNQMQRSIRKKVVASSAAPIEPV